MRHFDHPVTEEDRKDVTYHLAREADAVRPLPASGSTQPGELRKAGGSLLWRRIVETKTLRYAWGAQLHTR